MPSPFAAFKPAGISGFMPLRSSIKYCLISIPRLWLSSDFILSLSSRMDFSEFNSSQSYFRKEDNVVVCVLDDPFYPWIRHCGFFASNQKPAGFECSKSAFLGSEEDLKRPRAVCEMKCTETSASTQACAAALQYRISLKPKEEKRLNFVVAYSRQSTPELSDRQKKYMVSQNADNALQESSQFWGSK